MSGERKRGSERDKVEEGEGYRKESVSERDRGQKREKAAEKEGERERGQNREQDRER